MQFESAEAECPPDVTERQAKGTFVTFSVSNHKSSMNKDYSIRNSFIVLLTYVHTYLSAGV